MGHASLLGLLAVVLAATALAGLVALRLRIAPVAGLLIAGACIGPSGLGWIAAPEEIHRVAWSGLPMRGEAPWIVRGFGPG